ncbi:Putative MO25-like protein [Zea mays]|jgi:hypothetical protein|uniref:Putative MO25-like protein n=1 Tax=Zea mays TaxID=4577 RepID=A0A1D6EZS5_MAIZE|nr:Putative MO25-like protein [Zea mays]
MWDEFCFPPDTFLVLKSLYLKDAPTPLQLNTVQLPTYRHLTDYITFMFMKCYHVVPLLMISRPSWLARGYDTIMPIVFWSSD